MKTFRGLTAEKLGKAELATDEILQFQPYIYVVSGVGSEYKEAYLLDSQGQLTGENGSDGEVLSNLFINRESVIEAVTRNRKAQHQPFFVVVTHRQDGDCQKTWPDEVYRLPQ